MNDNQKFTTQIAIVVSVIFALFLYLQMCTASIDENYQVGISKIRFFHPGLLILSIMLLTAIIPGKAGKAMASFSQLFGYIALCICFGFFVLYFILDLSPVQSHWSFPNERTLLSTLKISLVHPDFSNRSLGGLVYTFLFSFLLILVAKRKVNKIIA